METIKDRLWKTVRTILIVLCLGITIFILYLIVPMLICTDLLKLENNNVWVGIVIYNISINTVLFGVGCGIFYWFRWLIIGENHKAGFSKYFEKRKIYKNEIKMKKNKQNGELSII